LVDIAYERSRKLIANLSALRTSLSAYIGNVDQFVPKLEPTASYSTKLLKGFEDVLDAMVSAIVGCLVARGKAKAYGDKDSVIWVPDRDKFTLPEGADISGIIEH
jgi:hypothetical protein